MTNLVELFGPGRRSNRSRSAHGLSNPIEVGRASIFDGNLDTLRKFVGVQLAQSVANTIKGVQRRLDYEQPLGCRLDLALPAIYGFNLGSDVDAGCQLPLNQRMGDAAGFLERAAGGKHEPLVGHIKSRSVRLSRRGDWMVRMSTPSG